MTLLFKRAARVVVDTIELVVDPASPGNSLDLSFSVVRSLKPEPNTAEIQIWNLNEDNRSALEDKGTLPGSVAKGEPPPKPPPGIACTIEAGYEEQTALLYSGTLRVAYTTREGADLITTLSAGDGEKEYQRSRVNLSIAKCSNKCKRLSGSTPATCRPPPPRSRRRRSCSRKAACSRARRLRS
jgi:hypothetical protein